MMASDWPKVHKSSLKVIASNYSLRCDAKQADAELRCTLEKVTAQDHFLLSELAPLPFVKGIQPSYIDQPTEDSVPVANTLSIQRLSLNEANCRHITREDYEIINVERRLRKGDVLLTVDGGVSIGKACLFSLEGDFTADSHVAIIRPKGISPLSLVYLLASPLGQLQFRKAESGASGQTTVTEDDIRRFVFPRSILDDVDDWAKRAERKRAQIARQREELDLLEQQIWDEFKVI